MCNKSLSHWITITYKCLPLLLITLMSSLNAAPSPSFQKAAPVSPAAPITPADDSDEEEMGEVDEDELIQEEENPDDDEGVTG